MPKYWKVRNEIIKPLSKTCSTLTYRPSQWPGRSGSNSQHLDLWSIVLECNGPWRAGSWLCPPPLSSITHSVQSQVGLVPQCHCPALSPCSGLARSCTLATLQGLGQMASGESQAGAEMGWDCWSRASQHPGILEYSLTGDSRLWSRSHRLHWLLDPWWGILLEESQSGTLLSKGI